MKTLAAGLLASVMAAALLSPGAASAQWRSPAVTAPPTPKEKTIAPGDFWVEPPTLVSLGFEWRVNGDGDHNAKVAVSYRKKGETAWHEALPLVRSMYEKVGNLTPPRPDFHPDPNNYVNPNMFSGSILNLQPGTTYEARFTMSDPDGVKGTATKVVTVTTRKEPMPYAGGHVYHVYPIGWTGPKMEPAFTGLMEAYYQGAASSDFEGSYLPRVQAGDTLLIHAGVYRSNRVNYQNGLPHPGYEALSTLFDGTYYLTASGTADKPIVMKSAGDGEVIFDGAGAQTFFNLEGANYNYFEGITFRNANLVFLLGQKNIAGSSGFTLKHSRLYDIGRGVQDDWSGSKNFYIADNVFIGRHMPDKMMGWNGGEWSKLPDFPEKLGGPQGSEYAVKLYGQGHVIAYNYAANWHDAFDVATYGDPDGVPYGGKEIRDRIPVSIDFYNNDMFNMGDNCIETDGGAHNIRVFNNRCMNSVGGALSATPLIGGPAYFYRNIVYNTSTGGILKYGTAANVLTYQNTFIGDVRTDMPNQFYFNNLVLGTNPPAPVFAISSYTNWSMSDYNGFKPNPTANHAFEWNTPPKGVAMDYVHTLPKTAYKSLAEYSAASGQDKHSILVDYSAFAHVTPTDRKDIQKLYNPEDMDFQLAKGSPAIDAGAVLPTITDGFTGKAPDLGALESGAPAPHYGPREMPAGKNGGDLSLRSIAGPPAGK